MDVFKKPQKICKGTPNTLQAPVLANPPARVYQFDSFVLDQSERIFLCYRNPVALPPKAFDVLCVLIESAGHLVTKATLLEKAWPDTFVEEANVSINIAILRKVLRESVGEQSYIETVRKRGYRFVAKVLELQGENALNVGRHEPETALVMPQESKPDVSAFNSLAVLPFENESKDPDIEYLVDGLTDSIINSFSHLENFRVIGRNTVFRYKAKSADPQKIGEKLGVRSLLTGRILRLGNQVIIRAEVVDVKGGWQIWGEQYHQKLADILMVQEEIAEEISEKLRLRLTARQALCR
jgi:TolB-like protein